jgi:hypothetical protein
MTRPEHRSTFLQWVQRMQRGDASFAAGEAASGKASNFVAGRLAGTEIWMLGR